MSRIDVNKLRGVYYNNDSDNYNNSYSSTNDLVDNLSINDELFIDHSMDNLYNDVEEHIVDFISKMPFCDYNNICNKNTKTLAKLEIYYNLLNVIAEFNSITSLSNIVLIYCDYFNLKYETVINELPNGVNMQLYEELKKHTRNIDELDKKFGINKSIKPLF